MSKQDKRLKELKGKLRDAMSGLTLQQLRNMFRRELEALGVTKYEQRGIKTCIAEIIDCEIGYRMKAKREAMHQMRQEEASRRVLSEGWQSGRRNTR